MSKGALSQAFVANNEDINEDVASEGVIKAEQKIKEIEEEKAADEKLMTAKQIVKDLNSAYTSAIRYERAKINFFLEKIAEIQGGDVNPSGNS